MKKLQYLNDLRVGLIKYGLKKSEVDGALQYYDELIAEAIEQGETEESVIARLPLPQAAADEIKGINEDSEVICTQAAQPTALTQPIQAPSEEEKAFQPINTPSEEEPKSLPQVNSQKSNQGKSIALTVVKLVLFALFIAPLAVAALSAVFAVFASFFAVIISMLASGVVLPIYGLIISIMGKSLMLLFVYFAIGFACLGLGLVMTKVAKPAAIIFVKIIKWLVKIFVSIIKRDLKGASYEKV